MSQCQAQTSRARRPRGQPRLVHHTMVDGAGAERMPRKHPPRPLNGPGECKSTTLDQKMQKFSRKAAQFVPISCPISCPHVSRAHLVAFFVPERLNFLQVRPKRRTENLNASISIARRHRSVLKGGRPRSWHHSHSDHDDCAHHAVRPWCSCRTLHGPGTNSPPQPTSTLHSTRCKHGRRKVPASVLTSRASWAPALAVLMAWVRAIAQGNGRLFVPASRTMC